MKKISNIVTFYKHKLLILFIPLLLGVYLLLKPQKSNISNYSSKNVTVTVIDVEKTQKLPIDKIIGGVLILSTLFAYLILKKNENSISHPQIELTVQEKRIYDLLKKGCSNKEIASEFNISVSTVKTHVNNIFKKKKVSSRNELFE
ncbi:MAG: hypothetical protein CR989_05120 [Flavobacteriales bacterium]|nr:MAG: hypothetical protein CR989_05120 [Flavobacteriales bacterium]